MYIQNTGWVGRWCLDQGAMFERGILINMGPENKKRRIASEDTDKSKGGVHSEFKFQWAYTESMVEFQICGKLSFCQT